MRTGDAELLRRARSDGDTRLLVTPAQHRSNGPGQNASTLRLFSQLDLQLFYSNNTQSAEVSGETVQPALAAAPAIVDVSATESAPGTVDFDAHVVGDPAAGIQGVWITYTGFANTWQSIDLDQDPLDSTPLDRPAHADRWPGR